MAKYYAVRVGRKTGIFTSWVECEAQVKFHSGAVYKSFALLSDAQAYLNDTPKDTQVQTVNLNDVGSNVTSQTRDMLHTSISGVKGETSYVGDTDTIFELPFLSPKDHDIISQLHSSREKLKTMSMSNTIGDTDSKFELSTKPREMLMISAPEKQTKPKISNDIQIYTDGSCVSEVGGYGIVYITSDKQEEYCGFVPFTPCTNNIAELYAIKYVLILILEVKEITPDSKITIYSDSIYSIKAVTVWYKKWKTNGWMTASGEVKNKDLIQDILKLIKKTKKYVSRLEFKHVKAHNGHKFNELADKLANQGRLM